MCDDGYWEKKDNFSDKWIAYSDPSGGYDYCPGFYHSEATRYSAWKGNLNLKKMRDEKWRLRKLKASQPLHMQGRQEEYFESLANS